jgi:hypothetical protein
VLPIVEKFNKLGCVDGVVHGFEIDVAVMVTLSILIFG